MEETGNPPESKKYKFKELKVYSSTEWLADNKKKYRQVLIGLMLLTFMRNCPFTTNGSTMILGSQF